MGNEITLNRPAASKAFSEIVTRAIRDIEAPIPQEDILKAVEGLDTEDKIALMFRLNGIIRRFFRGYQAEAQSPIPNALVMAQYGIAAGIACEAAEHLEQSIAGEGADVLTQHSTRALLAEVKRTILTKVTGQLILPPGVGGNH